jgi:hypothetical protein
MNAEREHKHLAQADRHIAKLKKDIARQWQIIEELSMGGQPLHEAISMLRLLKGHLAHHGAPPAVNPRRARKS